jgi:hypothetical protein
MRKLINDQGKAATQEEINNTFNNFMVRKFGQFHDYFDMLRMSHKSTELEIKVHEWVTHEFPGQSVEEIKISVVFKFCNFKWSPV